MSNKSSFLPEDYLAEKAERRTNIVFLVLFACLLLGWGVGFYLMKQMKSHQMQRNMAIAAQYQKANEEIKKLMDLKEHKEQMLEKAELAAALVERVPRSILLAELINRMPDRLSLLEFELKSDLIKTSTASKPANAPGAVKRLGPKRAQTKEQANEEVNKITAPRYDVSVRLVGVAPTDLEVSRYLTELNAYALLRAVNLEYSEQKEIEGQTMRKFEIRMKLAPNADVRNVEPRVAPRTIANPMTDKLEITPPMPAEKAVRAQNPGPEED